MKLLRILTGVHAGAQLRLARQRYLVGGDAQADIVLTDWREEPVCLAVGDDGQVVVQRPGSGAHADAAADKRQPEAQLDYFDDLVPRRFGDIVLCVGPTDAPWPSDVRLLESLVAPASRKRKKKRRQPDDGLRPEGGRRVFVAAGVTLSVALLVVFVGVIGMRGGADAVAAEPLQVKVARALQAANVSGVSVRTAQDGSVSVEGMVFDGGEASRLRAALAPFIGQRVAHRYASATDVAQAIGDALANPGLAVRYRGDGEFIVTGASVDLTAVRAKLQRIGADLGQHVSRITLSASELPPPQTVPTNALMSTGDMQYVQTRDGTKHLVIRSPQREISVLQDAPTPR